MADGQPKLIVGLGNPGPRYAKTRHNLGWMIVDEFAAQAAGDAAKTAWRTDKDAVLAEVARNGQKLHLLKPTAFMNKSGEAVQRISHFYKISPEEILVAHDELDLNLGAVRLKRGGGEGGHNGLRSLSACLGSREYMRLRVGVGRPPPGGSEDEIVNWLLSPFPGAEENEIAAAVGHAVNALFCILEQGLVSAQNRFNS